MFPLIRIMFISINPPPSSFAAVTIFFFLHLQLQIYEVNVRYMANTCQDLSYVLRYHVGQKFRPYVENIANMRDDQNHAQIT